MGQCLGCRRRAARGEEATGEGPGIEGSWEAYDNWWGAYEYDWKDDLDAGSDADWSEGAGAEHGGKGVSERSQRGLDKQWRPVIPNSGGGEGVDGVSAASEPGIVGIQDAYENGWKGEHDAEHDTVWFAEADTEYGGKGVSERSQRGLDKQWRPVIPNYGGEEGVDGVSAAGESGIGGPQDKYEAGWEDDHEEGPGTDWFERTGAEH